MATSLTTVITLTVVLTLPNHSPIPFEQRVENLGMCWAMARELTARAEEGPLKLGGEFSAACTVEVKKTEEH